MGMFLSAVSSLPQTVRLALRGLRSWTSRQVLVAIVTATLFGLLLGFATVLIPNSFFARDLPPVWWNYPVWLLTSALSGMLVATFVRGRPDTGVRNGGEPDNAPGTAGERRTSRFGIAGGLLAWFAVGCPVCNKLALLALGYSGAITWFAPLQPFLAIAALLLTSIALVSRLRGQVACPIPTRQQATVG